MTVSPRAAVSAPASLSWSKAGPWEAASASASTKRCPPCTLVRYQKRCVPSIQGSLGLAHHEAARPGAEAVGALVVRHRALGAEGRPGHHGDEEREAWRCGGAPDGGMRRTESHGLLLGKVHAAWLARYGRPRAPWRRGNRYICGGGCTPARRSPGRPERVSARRLLQPRAGRPTLVTPPSALDRGGSIHVELSRSPRHDATRVREAQAHHTYAERGRMGRPGRREMGGGARGLPAVAVRRGGPEALEGLSWAAWWLDDAETCSTHASVPTGST